jgi:hypothetical protein
MRKEIKMTEYDRKMSKIIAKKKPLHEALSEMLEYASTVTIKEDKSYPHPDLRK